MGLDDFSTEGQSSYTPKGGGSSNRGSSGGGGGRSWVTKLDFSKPYVVVAEDKEGNVYVSKSNMKVLKTQDDWKRLDEFSELENPPKQLRVIFQRTSLESWLRFCNLCINQDLGNPNELLEECPEELHFLDDQVYYPPARKVDTDRTCQVCGSTDSDKEVSIVQIKLEEHRKLPVCSHHTIEELAENGFLQ